MVYPQVVKAVVCDGAGGIEVLRIVDVDPPSVESGRVRIAVDAAALNRADLVQRRGFYPPPPGAPTTLGLECAGTVESVAADVGDLRPGDRVMALVAGGGQAELATVDRSCVISVPPVLETVEAGAFPEVFLTAHLNLFMLGGLASGGTALVHGGSGGVGTAAIQLARTAGVRIIVTAGSDERCRRCRELGADLAINYRDESFAEVCLDATGGAGVDLVLDCVGGRYLDDNLRALRVDGTLVVIGLMGGRSAELDLARLLMRRLRIVGSTLRALPVGRKAAIVTDFLVRFGDDLANGRLKPVIDSVFPLDRVADAHRRLESGKAFGKVVLTLR